ncbi:ABC transporter permease [Variovorax sp. KBS0712]|uniref:ABC transporter permease n=1 Tax=Variovorax sp. KBS0712 TaxID=2578111 RepID=UPI0011186B39|nr:ABC transporter permease [Variovorax sp. KBS0712]TSD59533.1 ABC transporter permease [Variovorax sp. KBS0712]
MKASLTVLPTDSTGTVHSFKLSALSSRLLVVLLLCIALALVSESFATTGNALNVLRQASLLFLLASGLTLVILTGGLDLSVGANVGLSACVAGVVIQTSGSITMGVLAAMACGTVVGLLNATLITVFRLPPFIATYGMLWAAHGVTYAYMAGESIHGFPPEFRALGSGYLLGLPIPVLIASVALVAGSYLTMRTTRGQEIYLMGSSAEVARLSGVPVRKRLFLVYTVSGLMAGLAALVFLARLNSAEGDIGEGLTLPAIAAVLLGGASLFGGAGTLAGTAVGALILTLVLNGMNLLAVNANWQPLVTGVVLLLAVVADVIGRRGNAR